MKIRLDKLLVERGLVLTRERAQALILAGRVLVSEQKLDKPGHSVDADAPIRLLGSDLRYVSRGGLKLEAALAHWQVDLAGRSCLDIGASTGGFTDCMLQHSADRVLAIDTGYGQIAQSLRDHPRVSLMERTNARLLNPGDLPPGISFLAMDVSFISATLVLPPVLAALRIAPSVPPSSQAPNAPASGAAGWLSSTGRDRGGQPRKGRDSGPAAIHSHALYQGTTSVVPKAAKERRALAPEENSSPSAEASGLKGHDLSHAITAEASDLKGHDSSHAVTVGNETGASAPEGTPPCEAIILIKPQFEAGREHVGKGGIVRDPAAHQLAIDRVFACVRSLGGQSLEVIPSPITGAEGNREFLLHALWP